MFKHTKWVDYFYLQTPDYDIIPDEVAAAHEEGLQV